MYKSVILASQLKDAPSTYDLNPNDFMYYLTTTMSGKAPVKAMMGTSKNILPKLEDLNLHFQIQSIPRSRVQIERDIYSPGSSTMLVSERRMELLMMLKHGSYPWYLILRQR
jgi:hypothetical protein